MISQESLLFEVFLILGANFRPENGNEGLHKIKRTNMPQSLDNKHAPLLFCFIASSPMLYFLKQVSKNPYFVFFKT